MSRSLKNTKLQPRVRVEVDTSDTLFDRKVRKKLARSAQSKARGAADQISGAVRRNRIAVTAAAGVALLAVGVGLGRRSVRTD